ncbi:atp-dependent clp protease adaptor protein [Nannochloropsis oceanica]
MSTVVQPAKPKITPQTDLGPSPVILVVEQTESETQLDGGWELILYNDEVNSRHHVARSLTTVCQLSDDQAYDVMMTAHKNGFAVVGEYTQEVAEGYCEGLRGVGIGCDVTKADSPE